jgi:hypothetical protein
MSRPFNVPTFGPFSARMGSRVKELIVNDRKQKNVIVNANNVNNKVRRAAPVFRAEREKDELATKANDRFLRSGAQIKDVYARLAK